MSQSGKVSIRMASVQDVEAIASFNSNMALETEGIELLPETIRAGADALINDDKLGFYLVAESEDRIVASLMVTTEWSDWRNGQFWWIQSVYVIPEFRRQGLYTRLYETVKDLAEKDENVCGFRLYVERNNSAAQATYRNAGMHETEYLMYEELKTGTIFHS